MTFRKECVEAEKLPLRAGGKEKERALAVLDYALNKILKLLHPFMPFITEELAHRMGFVAENDSIMFSQWPEANQELKLDNDIIRSIEGKFEMVRSGRNLRSSYSIADGKKLAFHIKAANETALEVLTKELDSLKHLLNASEIELGLEAFDCASRGAAPSQLGELGVISLPLAGLIDVEAECAKLEKQLKDIEKWLSGVRGRLSNEKFVNSAPAQVVADARKQLEELEAKKSQTESILAGLR